MKDTGQMKHGRRGAFIVVLAAGFMSLLDVSIVTVALPSIETGLGATDAQVQWIVAGYALTFGLLLVAAGRGGDIFGRRRLFIIGVSGFAVASLACGLAPTAGWLVASRLTQGLFAGILNPQVLGLIQDLYQGVGRAKAFGTYGMMVGVSTAVGPLLGGLLIAVFGVELGWRLVFLINIPVALAIVPLAVRWLPAAQPRGRPTMKAFDPVGVVLLGTAVVLFMWPFLAMSEGAGAGQRAPFWLAAIGFIALGIMWMWERWWGKHGGSALLDRRLVGSRQYLLGLSTGFFYFAGFTSIFIVTTLYLQQGEGFSPLQAGIAQMPFALISGVFAGIAGNLVSKYGRLVPIIGSVIMTVCTAAAALVGLMWDSEFAPWAFIGIVSLAGVGSGLVISPNQSLTLDAAPSETAGVAAALLQTMQRMGTAVGLAAVTTVFFLGVDATGFQTGAGYAMLVVCALMLVTVATNATDFLLGKKQSSIA